jgi:DNA-binding response OmpR family regulator
METKDISYPILIVEDDDGIRLSLRDFLKKKGYEVYVASDGVGAIKVLLDHRIESIITDYRMDIFGGDYWIRFLQRFCSQVDITITSGFLRPDFSVPFEILYKPFNYEELERRIGALRDKKRGGAGNT